MLTCLFSKFQDKLRGARLALADRSPMRPSYREPSHPPDFCICSVMVRPPNSIMADRCLSFVWAGLQVPGSPTRAWPSNPPAVILEACICLGRRPGHGQAILQLSFWKSASARRWRNPPTPSRLTDACPSSGQACRCLGRRPGHGASDPPTGILEICKCFGERPDWQPDAGTRRRLDQEMPQQKRWCRRCRIHLGKALPHRPETAIVSPPTCDGLMMARALIKARQRRNQSHAIY